MKTMGDIIQALRQSGLLARTVICAYPKDAKLVKAALAVYDRN